MDTVLLMHLLNRWAKLLWDITEQLNKTLPGQKVMYVQKEELPYRVPKNISPEMIPELFTKVIENTPLEQLEPVRDLAEEMVDLAEKLKELLLLSQTPVFGVPTSAETNT